jgi:hypothetical protein
VKLGIGFLRHDCGVVMLMFVQLDIFIMVGCYAELVL